MSEASVNIFIIIIFLLLWCTLDSWNTAGQHLYKPVMVLKIMFRGEIRYTFSTKLEERNIYERQLFLLVKFTQCKSQQSIIILWCRFSVTLRPLKSHLFKAPLLLFKEVGIIFLCHRSAVGRESVELVWYTVYQDLKWYHSREMQKKNYVPLVRSEPTTPTPHCTGGKRSALTSLKCVVCWGRLQQHSFSPQALRWGNKEMFDAAAELIPSHSLPQPHGDPGTCSVVCWRKCGLNLFI